VDDLGVARIQRERTLVARTRLRQRPHPDPSLRHRVTSSMKDSVVGHPRMSDPERISLGSGTPYRFFAAFRAAPFSVAARTFRALTFR
jgi:hypothetical protein